MIIHKVHAYSDITELLNERRQTVKIKTDEGNKKGNNSNYHKFLKKYYDLEMSMNSFNSIDLAYFFREIANENGYTYMLNMKKDASIFKRLRGSFESKEICGMIVFLYESEQNYLDKERLSPNVLASSWINTIYADFKLWLEDKYVPKNKSKKVREWSEETNEENVEIGVKL